MPPSIDRVSGGKHKQYQPSRTAKRSVFRQADPSSIDRPGGAPPIDLNKAAPLSESSLNRVIKKAKNYIKDDKSSASQLTGWVEQSKDTLKAARYMKKHFKDMSQGDGRAGISWQDALNYKA